MYNILCVDDTQANLFILESLFEQYNDKYNVITALSGEDALGVLLDEKIDIILLDVMMPGLNGFETAEMIKANKQTKNIPIIFLTAKKDNETIKSAFNYGVDYLSKPYGEYELFSRINSHLKLMQYQKELKKQLIFNQSIIDSQHNIIIINDETTHKMTSVNKSFLEFFHATSLEDFISRHSCISELFMEYENYFSLHTLNDGKSWINSISSNDSSEYNVLIMDIDTFTPCAFKIDVNTIENTNNYVITLTNITKLTTKSKHFEHKATYDALTGIYNRSKFNDILNEKYELFKRYQNNICFAIFDIDFFKKVNDTYGHIIGDKTLITFSKTINDAVRVTDTFARWGGEEFVLLMPETSLDNAIKTVDHLRKLIENTSFKEVNKITCSVGVSKFNIDDTIDNILIRSDEALYEAKESGRNKVCSK